MPGRTAKRGDATVFVLDVRWCLLRDGRSQHGAPTVASAPEHSWARMVQSSERQSGIPDFDCASVECRAAEASRQKRRRTCRLLR